MKKPSDSSRKTPPEGSRPRVIIEGVKPIVNGGRYPVKRTVGEKVIVTAHIFADGHDAIAARLRHKPKSSSGWTEVVMEPLGNDEWRGEFTVTQNARHLYTLEAWIDRFESWRNDLSKRVEAGQEVSSELLEGASLVSDAAQRAKGAHKKWLLERARALLGDSSSSGRTRSALDPELARVVALYPDRSFATAYDPMLEVIVDRQRARFGAWYEMFPRSAGPDPTRSATFLEAESRLPDIAEMGFDVLYLPPIHPIGKSFRKGANNTLASGPSDPGSPWAIGSEEGGHTAVEPGLGTLADFKHFLKAARGYGLEVALDLAFQCSPDHPYVKKHPEWFRHRPDGSIKYAENPPKKYQDIFPLNFESEDWRGLWSELKSVVLFWIEQGVKIFRVDNPHTKPFRFWEWLIREVQNEYSDVVFLAEAFTRPKPMYSLAKLGFSQSYSYFTWRNTKREIADYFTELTQTEVCEFYRPNLFTNTPDILHEYLQSGGRPAFQVRLVLAATLGGSYGIYGPAFELCENRAVPGTEEYKDSEKYEIRQWDLDRPGNIKDLIARVNGIRRENPALQHDRRLVFYPVDNEQLICYCKTTDDLSNVIVVVVNLDPHHPQDGQVQVPLETLGIGPDETYQVHDLISDERFLWRGPSNYVRLDPMVRSAHIFRVRRKIKTEKDLDYYE